MYCFSLIGLFQYLEYTLFIELMNSRLTTSNSSLSAPCQIDYIPGYVLPVSEYNS
jgi:hypothetical protein